MTEEKIPALGTSDEMTLTIAEEALGFARARVTQLISQLLVETNPQWGNDLMREFAGVLPHYHRALKMLVALRLRAPVWPPIKFMLGADGQPEFTTNSSLDHEDRTTAFRAQYFARRTTGNRTVFTFRDFNGLSIDVSMPADTELPL
jgi:hypothetical protein